MVEIQNKKIMADHGGVGSVKGKETSNKLIIIGTHLICDDYTYEYTNIHICDKYACTFIISK